MLKAVVIALLASLAFAALLATALRRGFWAKAAAAALTAVWMIGLVRLLGAPALLAGGIGAVAAGFLLRRGRFPGPGRNPGLGQGSRPAARLERGR
jgi:hypothetical protein